MSAQTYELSEADFDAFLQDASTPVLVDLWAPWCAPCRTMTPVVEKLAREMEGQLLVAKVNVEQYPAMMQRFGVRGIPTLLLFTSNEQPQRLVGVQTSGQLTQWLEENNVTSAIPLTNVRLESPGWSSFYNDDDLKEFFTRRAIHHARAGELVFALDSYWADGRGTLSAAVAHQANSEVFSRVTGLPPSLANLLDCCAFITEEQVAALFSSLSPGKDYQLVPLRFMHWFLSDEFAPWHDYLSHPILQTFLKQWQLLTGKLLSGAEVTSEEWLVISQNAAKLLVQYEAENRPLESIVAALLVELSPAPATTMVDNWSNIARHISWAVYQHMQILDGWSNEDRGTPVSRMRWFDTKAEQSPSGQLSEHEIIALREEWESTHVAFFARENHFYNRLEELSAPQIEHLQSHLCMLLTLAPEF
ncbi:TPA: thioredoxin [Klebsiella pneumoniae]|nr:thioredoxin [Klebsiella pneumoniae]